MQSSCIFFLNFAPFAGIYCVFNNKKAEKKVFDFPRALHRLHLFEELRVVFLLTGTEGQIGFHTGFGLGIDQIHSLYYIVYPYAFTCSGQHFFGGIMGDNIQPIGSNTVTNVDVCVRANASDLTNINEPMRWRAFKVRLPQNCEGRYRYKLSKSSLYFSAAHSR